MVEDVQESDYIALAELRLRIREFLRGSDEASRQAGLEPQQYQLLLALRAVADPSQATIGRLAESLHLKHHSVVGLVDRLEARGFVRRRRNADNRREVRVVLLAPGRDAVRNVVSQRLHELRGSGRALVESIAAILNSNQAEKVSSSS
jgi:DNA-binding MarR family transcriptional regulator